MNKLFALLLCTLFSFNCANAELSLPPISLAAPPEQRQSEAVTLYGEVDMASAAKVIAGIQAQNKIDTKLPILLFINSPGGDVIAGNMILDAMMASRRPIITVDVGMAASMAAFVFEAGSKRVISPGAILMFHEASMGAQGDLSHVRSRVDVVSRLVDRYETFVAKRAGISLEAYRAHAAAQWWLLDSEAVDAKLADVVALIPDYPPPSAD